VKGSERIHESRWSKPLLAIYFVLFLIFLYGSMIVMAVLSFNGPQGGISFPLDGTSLNWWKALFDSSVPGSNATQIKDAALKSLYLGLVAGAVTSVLALTLSMAFKRRFRFDGVVFFLVLLCLMTPGFLLSLGTSFFWSWMDLRPDIWKTALGTNVIWALPFGFLVMIAVWNRYEDAVEEGARDLGANALRTFREITLPLVWTGVFGTFLFGFTLSWNEYDRTALFLSGGDSTLPIRIFSFTTASVIRPDLYALGTGTTAVALLAVVVGIAFALVRLWRRGSTVEHETQVAEELGRITGGEGRGAAAGDAS
jgi:putative spermidine/putrescine transport system permease protein